jgi:hypothetical protein
LKLTSEISISSRHRGHSSSSCAAVDRISFNYTRSCLFHSPVRHHSNTRPERQPGHEIWFAALRRRHAVLVLEDVRVVLWPLFLECSGSRVKRVGAGNRDGQRSRVKRELGGGTRPRACASQAHTRASFHSEGFLLFYICFCACSIQYSLISQSNYCYNISQYISELRKIQSSH